LNQQHKDILRRRCAPAHSETMVHSNVLYINKNKIKKEEEKLTEKIDT
jgi:hypothetical protein